MMPSHFENELDAVDASVFTGDVLCDPDNRVVFKEFCESWLRAIAQADITFAEATES